MNDDNNQQQSPDDALENRDDGMVHPTQDEPKLPEDNTPPAAPADDTTNDLPADHPVTDSNVDSQETHDAGVTTASGADAQEEGTDDNEQPRPLDPPQDQSNGE